MRKNIVLIIVLGLVMLSACTNTTPEDISLEESSSQTENIDEDKEGEIKEETLNQDETPSETSDESSKDNNSSKETEQEVENDDLKDTNEASADANSNSNGQTENVGESNEVATSETNNENTNNGQLSYIQTISISPNYVINEEKVNAAVESGFPSPITELDLYNYTLKNSDVIQYVSQRSSFELGESISHTGFNSLEVVYERSQYTWDDFFGDLEATEYNREITVSLKGESIFEADIVDEYEKYYRYYDENEGLYYEVQDLMMGNFTDPNSELTNTKIGNSCNYNSLDGLIAPTYNPLVFQNGEEVLNYYITALDDKPCVFIETIFQEKLYRTWVDIEYGIVVKELVFDSEGLLVDKKIATSITKKDIDDSVFIKPNDVEFTDITLFIYSFEGGNLDGLIDAVENTLPEEETGIELRYSEGLWITLYTTGMGDQGSIDDVIYVSKYQNNDGEEVTIRRIKDDRFYTIHDGMQIVEIYDESCYEQKFFNFEDVGLLSVVDEGDRIKYAFYDPNNISVSGLFDVYEYVVEEGEFVAVNYYEIESIANNEPVRDVISYSISFIDFDESVYDDSCMDTYEIIDHGEGSINDGEHMPFWYEGE